MLGWANLKLCRNKYIFVYISKGLILEIKQKHKNLYKNK